MLDLAKGSNHSDDERTLPRLRRSAPQHAARQRRFPWRRAAVPRRKAWQKKVISDDALTSYISYEEMPEFRAGMIESVRQSVLRVGRSQPAPETPPEGPGAAAAPPSTGDAWDGGVSESSEDEVEEVALEEHAEPRGTLEEIQEAINITRRLNLRLGDLKRSRDHIETLSGIGEDTHWNAYLAEGRRATRLQPRQRQVFQFLYPRSKRSRTS